MSFEQLDLHPNIHKAIAACGYTNPTPVQAQSIPGILAGKDSVVSAQTGTGKTAAFVLPALQRLCLQEPSKKTRILILTPTRELASQITQASDKYGKFLNFNIVNLVGGMPYHNQIRDLERGADIIVATPGRLMDHMEQKRVDLSYVEMLVLDEADRMLDMGFIEDVQYIAKLTPSNRQTLLFSATVDKELTQVVRHLLKDPLRIDLSSEVVAAPKIKQEMYKATSPQQKLRLLKHFLSDENVYKAIIFSATKIMADKLTGQLRDQGFAAAALHGDLRQNVRNRTVEQLRRGKIQFLVATDVAARGIDISDVTHVINFDLPRFCEDYVHRIGRTGRAGKTGVAISFVLPSETRQLQRIERYINQRIKLVNNVEIDDVALSELVPARKAALAESERADRERQSRSGKRGGSRGGFSGRSERGSDRPRFKKEFSDKRERHSREEFAPRRERNEREEFAPRRPRGERDDFSAKRERSERDEFAPRRERSERNEFASKRSRGDKDGFAPRGERSERNEFAPKRSRGERDGFAPRRERSERDEFAPKRARGERNDFAPRRERSERDEFAPKRERRDRSDFSPRGERGKRDDFAPKRERGGRGDFSSRNERSRKDEFAPKRERGNRDDFAPRKDRNSSRKRDDRVAFVATRERQEKRGEGKFVAKGERSSKDGFAPRLKRDAKASPAKKSNSRSFQKRSISK